MSKPIVHEMSDEQLKAAAIQLMQKNQSKESKFPTERISLPSKGLNYPEGHPLATGYVEMRYMTAKEEDILTSTNLINQGLVLDKLCQSLLVTDFNYNDLLVGDKNAIIIAARILSYGKKYPVKLPNPWIEDSNSPEMISYEVDLTQIEAKPLPTGAELKQGQTEFSVYLPNFGKDVKYRLLTHGIEQEILKEVKSLSIVTKATGVDPTNSVRLKHIIVEVDGSRDPNRIRTFVDAELLIPDLKILRRDIQDRTPDLDLTFTISNPNDTTDIRRFNIPINIDFFWPGV